ncbi:hypothetical protein M2T82_02105 [Elizabethkingia ursingii]|uniref:hypothetical protein n=1 Tax=Elizabethkingia ursingii TaxID=1756150 RepID=UPI0020115A01|nr:hypothetical protein [Elizabethkingia ursingii]MCL1666848.1 hypothetical protein [Elizabethkingia ursingii]
MKNIYTLKNINRLAVLGIITTFFISCSSRDENPANPTPNPAEGTVLTFNITGIAEEGNVTNIATASVNNKLTGVSLMAKNEIVSAGGFDVITSAEGPQTSRNTGLAAAASAFSSGTGAMAASTPMQNGIKYRLLIYDAVSNTLVKDVDGTAGTVPNIQVDGGKQYKWYIISTNSTISPTVNTTTGMVSGSSLANKDILYNQGVVTTEYGQNNLNILFRHYTSRIDVKLDTRGMFGSINNTSTLEVGTGTGSSFASIIKTGDLNLFTATYTNLQDAPAVTAANMVNTAGAGGAAGSTKTATFYTVSSTNVPANNLRLRMGTLDLTMDNNTTRSFTNSIVPYSNASFTPVLTSKYNINAQLVESGVRVKGLLWARTNLTYNTSQADQYRFKVNNEYADPDKDLDYWNWMSATPTGSSSDNVDPCSRIYPENTWRMPTSTEFNSLGDPDQKNENYGLLVGAVYSAVWNLDTGNSVNTAYPEKSQNLFIPLYGYRSTPGLLGSSIIDSPVGLVAGLLGAGSAYYGTSTATNASNANFYYIRYFRLAFLVGWSNSEIKNAAKTEGRSIRCVRSTSTPNA